MKKILCAIYTRKSSEEGLEQEFNSLHAQREACSSYIASQKHEGWVLLPDHYDDGGVSGGTLEREALQRLLRDVDDGKVDQIIVYKIDRLTRSLTDFAKLVERLDAAEASFVSVTQSFNTATSMGRLTLNVLLSFAQFEREVTAERIRDKIAASKKKGLWMGGNIPYGYEPEGRTLKIRPKEAETVRLLYDLYLRHQSLIVVTKEADRICLERHWKGHGKQREETTGDVIPFRRGTIHHILSNPVYAGKIRHHDKVYDGQHPAIIDPQFWDEVQELLKSTAARKRGEDKKGRTSLLAGRLFDETGDRLTPSHTKKNGRRYRYYVSKRLIVNHKETNPDQQTGGWRLPAKALEDQLVLAVTKHLCDRLVNALSRNSSVDEISRIQSRLEALQPQSATPDHEVILTFIKRVNLCGGRAEIVLDENAIATELSLDLANINPDALKFQLPFRHRKRGIESKFILGNEPAKTRDVTLIRNIAKAHQYYEAIKQGRTFEDIATSENLSKRRILQVIDLAFLAPDIVKSILQGNQPIGLTAKWLGQNPLPSDWSAQREIIARL